MDRLKRKYILPGSVQADIPKRTRRLWKKRSVLFSSFFCLLVVNLLHMVHVMESLHDCHDFSANGNVTDLEGDNTSICMMYILI